MRRQIIYVTLPICVAIIVAGAWIANAGDLNPPPGPVAPSMVTLDDIASAVSNSESDCDPCVWQVKGVQITSGGSWYSLFPEGTSGTVRSIVVSKGGTDYTYYRLREHGADQDYLVVVNVNAGATGVSLPSVGVPCDFRFTNGLEYTGGSYGGSFTIYYRLD